MRARVHGHRSRGGTDLHSKLIAGRFLVLQNQGADDEVAQFAQIARPVVLLCRCEHTLS